MFKVYNSRAWYVFIMLYLLTGPLRGDNASVPKLCFSSIKNDDRKWRLLCVQDETFSPSRRVKGQSRFSTQGHIIRKIETLFRENI